MNSQRQNRSTGHRARRANRALLTPAAQVLVDTALDTIGALIAMAGFTALGGSLSYRVGLLICLALAGLDLIFRTSIRQALLWTGKGLYQGCRRSLSRTARPRPAEALAGQETAAPPPDSAAEPLPELAE